MTRPVVLPTPSTFCLRFCLTPAPTVRLSSGSISLALALSSPSTGSTKNPLFLQLLALFHHGSFPLHLSRDVLFKSGANHEHTAGASRTHVEIVILTILALADDPLPMLQLDELNAAEDQLEYCQSETFN